MRDKLWESSDNRRTFFQEHRLSLEKYLSNRRGGPWIVSSLNMRPHGLNMNSADGRDRSPLPPRWAVIENCRNPSDELATLYADMAMAKARIEDALRDLGSRHRIPIPVITKAMTQYADHLVLGVVDTLKRKLQDEIKAQEERGAQ